MCGSTELVKQDGVFVCQTCGCKYSVEEAKKMMVEGVVEVTGTVKVDNSAAIDSFVELARNARDTGSYKEADSYCNKVIEMGAENWEIWFIKGCAVGWQSTLSNRRIPETINAFFKAIEYCDEEHKSTLVDLCIKEYDSLNTAILRQRLKGFSPHPTDQAIQGLGNDIQCMLKEEQKLADTVLYSPSSKIEYGKFLHNNLFSVFQALHENFTQSQKTPDCISLTSFSNDCNIITRGLFQTTSLLGTDFEGKAKADLVIKIHESIIYIENALIKAEWQIRDACTNALIMAVHLKPEEVKVLEEIISQCRTIISQVKKITEQHAAKEAQERRDKYWASHPDEKSALESEKQQLESDKAQLEASLSMYTAKKDVVPAASECKTIAQELSSLKLNMESLGLFKRKEKKELQAQIDASQKKLDVCKQQLELQEAEIEKEMEPISAKYADVTKRLQEIDNELTRDRPPA
jgi:hypothetical protein